MKKKTTFGIEEEIAKKFDKIAEANSLNKSAFIQKKIEEYIKENEKKKQ